MGVSVLVIESNIVHRYFSSRHKHTFAMPLQQNWVWQKTPRKSHLLVFVSTKECLNCIVVLCKSGRQTNTHISRYCYQSLIKRLMMNCIEAQPVSGIHSVL